MDFINLLQEIRSEIHCELQKDRLSLYRDVRASMLQIIQNKYGHRTVADGAEHNVSWGMLDIVMQPLDHMLDQRFRAIEDKFIDLVNERFISVQNQTILSASEVQAVHLPSSQRPPLTERPIAAETGSVDTSATEGDACELRTSNAEGSVNPRQSKRLAEKAAAECDALSRSGQIVGTDSSQTDPSTPMSSGSGLPPSSTAGSSVASQAIALEGLAGGREGQLLPATLSVTADEWYNFAELYDRARSMHQSDGVVLIRLPSSIQATPSIKIKPKIREVYHQQLEWSDSGTWARVLHQKKTYRRPATWAINPSDELNNHDALSMSRQWEGKYGPDTRNHRLCAYAANMPAHEAVSRATLGLPDTSPIHRLQGNRLTEIAPEMQGITLPDSFGSARFGPVFQLHQEDFEMPAINALYIGSETWWLTVAAEHMPDLLEALDRDGAARKDDLSDHQYLRHNSIFLLPRYLDVNMIPYKCFLQPQGHAVLLFQGTCHEGFRCGANLAEAVNYYPPDWVPPIVKECSFSCNGHPPITREMMMPKKHKMKAHKRPGKRRRRAQTSASTSLEESHLGRPADDAPNSVWLEYITHHDASISTQISRRLGESRVMRAVLALWSRRCLIETCRVVKQWNEPVRELICNCLDVPAAERLERDDLIIAGLRAHASASEAFPNILKVKRSRSILAEYGRQTKGQRCLKYKSLYKAYAIPEDRDDLHSKVYRRFNDGRRFDNLCGKYDVGLLVMISVCRQRPFHLTCSDYLKLTQPEVSEFLEIIGECESFVTVCNMATRFVSFAFGGKLPDLHRGQRDIESLCSTSEAQLPHELVLED